MYGVLKGNTNTGDDNELAYVFATPLNVVSNQPAFVSDTMSLKRKVNTQQVQRWEIEAEIASTNDSDEFLLHSVENGMTDTFLMRMPQTYRKDKIEQIPIEASNSVIRGSNIIPINKVGSVNIRGQFINFLGNSKVYLVLEDTDTQIKITPPLLTTISIGTDIVYGDLTTCKCRYDTDTRFGMLYEDGIMVSPGTVRYIEAL